MECDKGSPARVAQCSAGSAMGRRNTEVKSEASGSERVALTVGVKTSKPKVSIKLSSCFCKDSDCNCVAHQHGGDEPKAGSDSDYGPGAGNTNVEASRRGAQRGRDEGTAAAQTQPPSTKPKAGTLVAHRHLINGNKAASLGDQSLLPRFSQEGTAHLGRPSLSAGQDEASGWKQPSNTSREESKRQYYRELCLQVEERKQQRDRERSRNTVDELKHNDTMQHSIWGMPGSGAPNFHLGTVKRTNSLYTAGILPQEQIRVGGFSGTPFHRLCNEDLNKLRTARQPGK